MKWLTPMGRTSPFDVFATLLGLAAAAPCCSIAAQAHGRPDAVVIVAPGVAENDVEGPGPARITVGAAIDLVGNPVRLPVPSYTGNTAGASSPYLGGSSGLFPVTARHVTSGFGLRMHPLLGGLRQHAGVDLAAPLGSPVLATVDGIVGQAGAYGNYGLLVGVKASAGLETRYGHLSRLNVASGQAVRRGQVLGWSGSTGLSTGPHLHYEVRVNGRAVNPLGR